MSDNNEILTPQEMMDLSQSAEGRRILFSYIVSARIGYAMQTVFETLEIEPEPGVQTKCCEIVYNTLFRVPIDNIMQWCADVAKWREERYSVGNC